MYHILFIHSFVDGRLGCFHILAIVGSAALTLWCMYLFELVFLEDLGTLLIMAFPCFLYLHHTIPFTLEPANCFLGTLPIRPSNSGLYPKEIFPFSYEICFI